MLPEETLLCLDILRAALSETTILFSTHILTDVERICTDAAFLHGGKIVLQGKIGEVTADASASRMQFFKSIPMTLIIYILVTGSMFTREYQSGTPILVLTKGLRR